MTLAFRSDPPDLFDRIVCVDGTWQWNLNSIAPPYVEMEQILQEELYLITGESTEPSITAQELFDRFGGCTCAEVQTMKRLDLDLAEESFYFDLYDNLNIEFSRLGLNIFIPRVVLGPDNTVVGVFYPPRKK